MQFDLLWNKWNVLFVIEALLNLVGPVTINVTIASDDGKLTKACEAKQEAKGQK